MTRRLALLITTAFVAATGAWFQRGAPEELRRSSQPAGAALTSSASAPAEVTPSVTPRVARWHPVVPAPWGAEAGPGGPAAEAWPADSFASLRAAEVGDAVSLAWPDRPAWHGRVTLRFEDEHGLRLGATSAEEIIDLHWDRDGALRGRVWFQGAAVAWQITATAGGPVQVIAVPLAQVICAPDAARFPDRLGLIAESRSEVEAGAEATAPGVAPESTGPLRVSSLPGSPRVIWLDLEGDTITGTAWNTAFMNGNPFIAEPSALGLAQQRALWERVSDDYAPFDINVTTERSVYLAAAATQRIRVIVTPTSYWYPNHFIVGVAFLGEYGTAGADPCFAFERSAHSWAVTADVASHEAGHTFNLHHHGRGSSEYYGGHGKWAPLMGSTVDFPRHLTQWAKGEYTDATKPNQLDLAVIESRGVPRRNDDHGDTPETATHLTAVASGTGLSWQGTGLIGREDDVDAFRIEVPESGTLWWEVVPSSGVNNLAVEAELSRADGTLVSAPATLLDSWAAGASHAVTAGTYILKVRSGSRGNPTSTGFSTYGSLGHYQADLGLNVPRRTHVALAEPAFTSRVNRLAYERPVVKITNTSAFATSYRIASSHPDYFKERVTPTLQPGTEGSYTIDFFRENFPLGVTAAQLLISATPSLEPREAPVVVTVSGSTMQTELMQPVSIPAVLTSPTPPTLTVQLGPLGLIEDAWQIHTISVSRPNLVLENHPVTAPLMYRFSVPFTTTFTLNPALPAGTYNESIIISARPGTSGHPRVLPLVFTIPEPVVNPDTSAIDSWTVPLATPSSRTFAINDTGSLVQARVRLTTNTPGLSISPSEIVTPGSFTLTAIASSTLDPRDASVTLTVVSGPTVIPPPVPYPFTINTINTNAVVASPAALNWTRSLANDGATSIQFSHAPGGTGTLSYQLTSTIPGLTTTPSSFSLSSGAAPVSVVVTAPTLPFETVTTGTLQVRLGGEVIEAIPLTVHGGYPPASQPRPLSAGSWSALDGPAPAQNRAVGVAVRLRGLRTPDAASVRAVLWPPEGPPISLLAGAAQGTAWADQTLILTPDGTPLPEFGGSLPAEATIGPSDYLTARGQFATPPADWPQPPYGRPLLDVLGQVHGGIWRLWIEGTADAGAALLGGGWDLAVINDIPVMRPLQAWIPADTWTDRESDPLKALVVGTVNGFVGPNTFVYRHNSGAPWVRLSGTVSNQTSGSTFTLDGRGLNPGHHRSAINFRGWHEPQLDRTTRLDVRVWNPEDWALSLTGPGFEVGPGALVATSPVLVQGAIEWPSGIEVHLSDIECSNLADLELVLIDPQGQRLPLQRLGEAGGWHLGDLRFLDASHPAAYTSANAGTVIRNVPHAPPGSAGPPRGLNSWMGKPILGTWLLEARWNPAAAGVARLREGWALRLHAQQFPVGAVPSTVWMFGLTNVTARTTLQFTPLQPGMATPAAIPADSFLQVEQVGANRFELSALTAPATKVLTSAINWTLPDGSVVLSTPVHVRSGNTAWDIPRGPGRTVRDSGTMMGGPSPIEIRGVRGPINTLSVRLHGLSSPTSNRLRAVLESPEGIGYCVFDNLTFSPSLNIARLIFSGNGSSTSRSVTSEETTIQPQRTSTAAYPGIEHLHPYTLGFGNVSGRRANGVWKLHLVDTHADGQFSNLAGWDLNLTFHPGYEPWQTTHGVGGPGDDDDGDGFTNLQEWYFGTDPTAADGAAGLHLPTAEVSVQSGAGERLQLSYRRRLIAGRVIETTAETWSADAAAWINAPILQRTFVPESDYIFERVILILDLPPAPHQLARLRLTL